MDPALPPIDREKIVPFLLKIYLDFGRHHPFRSYTIDRTPPESHELQLYTWRDATLRELVQLVQEAIPEAQTGDAHLSFRLIYMDTDTGFFKGKDLAVLHAFESSQDDNKTLHECRFLIGDYLDIAVHDGPPRYDAPRRYR
ncbi:Sin3 associated polypeptide p18 [Hesseltinella vesiculosa]|uniref:Sin3 associated polypeptide p18 n=1 Tax=Hesseltinella vesiculosa TaxID=101127 RepID=A0A1X2GSJ5_9FUNG|nr:Sin3 associated polypeptide p18 [Hesseltinella vesiculosa]